MLTNNVRSVAEIRTQEMRQLPKILAGGAGLSLLLHLLMAIACNYLPTSLPTDAVEITIIDANELPPEPRPTATIKKVPKVMPRSPSVLKISPVTPAKPASKSITPPTKTAVVSPPKQRSPVGIPTKVAKRFIDQPPSPKQEQTIAQKSPTRSINPISFPQPSFNDLDHPNVSRPATPVTIPSSPVSPNPKPTDNLDQFNQDTVGILLTPTENTSASVNNPSASLKSNTGSKIVPSIATNPSSNSSSSTRVRAGTALGKTKNTVDVKPGKDRGFGMSTQTSGKVGSGSSVWQSPNSGRDESSSIISGSRTGQATINSGKGGTAKNDNSSTPASVALQCAPNSDCKPPYPEEANGAQGTTVLEILLADDGSVSNTKISKSSGNNLFDQAAIDAAPTMRFMVPSGRQRKFRVAIKFTPDAD